MGTLRWQQLLDAAIAESSSQSLSRIDAEVLIALRVAVYQLRFLARIPTRAAINESVELVKRARKRSAASFVNAVLRKIAAGSSKDGAWAPPEITGDSAEELAIGSSHPLWLVERWARFYGLDAARSICTYNQCAPVTALRLRRPEANAHLLAEGIELESGALLASARRVQHGAISSSASIRSGLCVIQDEASQLVAALVGHGEQILDCCAAPGGKTLALADRNPRSIIIAAELHSHRARLLRRLMRAVHPQTAGANVNVLAADARHLPLSLDFDRVLVDVPCSGTGTLARNPEIKWRLQPADLLDLQGRQIAILGNALRQLAPDGLLVYSTCSLEREENEDVVAASGAEVVRTIERIPGRDPGDGFFAAVLRSAVNCKW